MDKKYVKNRHYYIEGEPIPYKEDQTHEFKAHRDFAWEDLSPRSIVKKSHQPLSRTFCGYLNSSIGGTVYVGVSDDGIVQGQLLTQYQKDHITLCMKELMSRFKPPVSSDLYCFRFVPALPKDCVDIASELCYDSKQHASRYRRLRPHLIESSRTCWCDTDAIFQVKNNIIPPKYVVEIRILPNGCQRSKKLTPADIASHPIYQNEEGKIFVRYRDTVRKSTAALITKAKIKLARDSRVQQLQNLIAKLQVDLILP